jgi:hypothetical protein
MGESGRRQVLHSATSSRRRYELEHFGASRTKCECLLQDDAEHRNRAPRPHRSLQHYRASWSPTTHPGPLHGTRRVSLRCYEVQLQRDGHSLQFCPSKPVDTRSSCRRTKTSKLPCSTSPYLPQTWVSTTSLRDTLISPTSSPNTFMKIASSTSSSAMDKYSAPSRAQTTESTLRLAD